MIDLVRIIRQNAATLPLLGLLALACFVIGCSERDVPAVDDEEQILSYMRISEDAADLFALDSLREVDYVFPYHPGTFRDAVDSVKRFMSVALSSSTVDVAGIGNVREAIVNVSDEYYVTVRKIAPTVSGPDTTYKSFKRTQTRNAHFLKLGDDSRPFVGWKLFGYAGYNHTGLSIPVQVSVNDSSGAVDFNGDASLFVSRPYASGFNTIPTIRLDEIPQITASSELGVAAKIDTTISTKVFLTFFSALSAGEPYRKMDSVSDYHAVDTIKTPAGNERIWHTMTFASFDYIDSWPTVRAIWTIPYRTKL